MKLTTNQIRQRTLEKCGWSKQAAERHIKKHKAAVLPVEIIGLWAYRFKRWRSR